MPTHTHTTPVSHAIMALFKSHLVTQASGSVGGTTYSHTRSGLYMRARSIPVNPNTANQLAVRAALTTLVTVWTQTLTPARRAAWDLYAANTPVVNALGDPINLSGQNWFIAANTPRIQSNTKIPTTPISPIYDAPTVFDRGAFDSPTYVASEAAGITVSFNAADTWNQAAGAMFVYQGRPQNPSRNFYKGPFRLIAAFDGSTPATSPINISAATVALLGYPFVVGQNLSVRFVVSQADCRLSSPRVVGPQLTVA